MHSFALLWRHTRRISSALPVLLLLMLLALPQSSTALRHSFSTHKDPRTVIGPVGVPFGFAAGGRYKLTVFDFELSGEAAGTPGFFLHRFANDAAYTKYLNRLQSNASQCAFQYFLEDDHYGTEGPLNDDTMAYEEVGEITSAVPHGILLSMRPKSTKWKPHQPSIEYAEFQPHEAGLYFLTYQVCGSGHVQSSFSLDFEFLNVNAVTGQITHLTAGEMHLPFLFFFFAMSYLLCLVFWIWNLQNIGHGGPGIFLSAKQQQQRTAQQQQQRPRPVVYPIHKLMGALLAFKFLAVFFECVRYHAIRITGHAELWSVVYLAMNFCKGIFLFTVLLLIGTGWSFVKPFLNANEKRIICSILLLQVINNVALAVLSHETAGERRFDQWSAVLHLVDILCCCAVLLPIVWQVNALEKSLPQQQPEAAESSKTATGQLDEFDTVSDDDEEEGADTEDDDEGGLPREKNQLILSKLKLFRSFYLLVVAYIYLTRIIVYLFATLLDYRHLWMRYAVSEVVTLSFYVTVGILFRPMVENPYLSVKQDDDDENTDDKGIAMQLTSSSRKK